MSFFQVVHIGPKFSAQPFNVHAHGQKQWRFRMDVKQLPSVPNCVGKALTSSKRLSESNPANHIGTTSSSVMSQCVAPRLSGPPVHTFGHSFPTNLSNLGASDLRTCVYADTASLTTAAIPVIWKLHPEMLLLPFEKLKRLALQIRLCAFGRLCRCPLPERNSPCALWQERRKFRLRQMAKIHERCKRIRSFNFLRLVNCFRLWSDLLEISGR